MGAGTNDTLKTDALNGYVDGFMSLYEKEGGKIWECIDKFNECLALKAREDFIKKNLIKNGKDTVMLFVHENKFNNIANKYISK